MVVGAVGFTAAHKFSKFAADCNAAVQDTTVLMGGWWPGAWGLGFPRTLLAEGLL